MIEINIYKNRQGQHTATVIKSEFINDSGVPAQRRYKVKPHNSFSELLEYLGERIQDDGRIIVLSDAGEI